MTAAEPVATWRAAPSCRMPSTLRCGRSADRRAAGRPLAAKLAAGKQQFRCVGVSTFAARPPHHRGHAPGGIVVTTTEDGVRCRRGPATGRVAVATIAGSKRQLRYAGVATFAARAPRCRKHATKAVGWATIVGGGPQRGIANVSTFATFAERARCRRGPATGSVVVATIAGGRRQFRSANVSTFAACAERRRGHGTAFAAGTTIVGGRRRSRRAGISTFATFAERARCPRGPATGCPALATTLDGEPRLPIASVSIFATSVAPAPCRSVGIRQAGEPVRWSRPSRHPRGTSGATIIGDLHHALATRLNRPRGSLNIRNIR